MTAALFYDRPNTVRDVTLVGWRDGGEPSAFRILSQQSWHAPIFNPESARRTAPPSSARASAGAAQQAV
jgi:hypothetical protein